MQLSDLVATSEAVAGARSRLDKVGLLAEALRRLVPSEVRCGVAFLSGEPGERRIGVGQALLTKACGPPAQESCLSLADVEAALARVAALAGHGSAGERQRLLGELMGRATADEQRFLASLLVGGLRQGALDGVMADAIARAADVPASAVRRALMLAGESGSVAECALRDGLAGVGRFDLVLFRAVQPMLAQTAGGVGEALERLGEAALEWKLDGARIQVHRSGDEVRVFTRGLNDVTSAVPEVVEAARGLHVSDFILDGEVLALRPDGWPLPFQTTMRRFGRKLDVERLRAELPLRPFFFDCLFAHGQSLIERPEIERGAVLAELAPAPLIVPRARPASLAEGEAFLVDALKRGHEGIMAKALDAAYEAGSRGRGWLKIKPAHTLDLVVLAAEWGSGRRRPWLSNLHLGARDPNGGGFVMLGKTFKGLTDEMLAWQTRRLLELERERRGHVVHVRPELVVEVAFNDVQASPRYPGGLALRFARVKRYRSDKGAADADTIDSVRALHAARLGEPSGAERGSPHEADEGA